MRRRALPAAVALVCLLGTACAGAGALDGEGADAGAATVTPPAGAAADADAPAPTAAPARDRVAIDYYPVVIQPEEAPALATVMDVHAPPPMGEADQLSATTADGRWSLAVVDDPTGEGSWLQVTDTTTQTMPAQLRLTSRVRARDIALTPDEQQVMVPAGTHTLVVDVADPTAPTIVGRVADYMVRNHTTVDIQEVSAPTIGSRTFMTITSRLNGGTGCPTGTVHLYDITGPLASTPLMVAESDVAQAPVDDGQPCTSEGTVFFDRLGRGVVVRWDGHEELEWSPYDITAEYQSTATYCVLVASSDPL